MKKKLLTLLCGFVIATVPTITSFANNNIEMLNENSITYENEFTDSSVDSSSEISPRVDISSPGVLRTWSDAPLYSSQGIYKMVARPKSTTQTAASIYIHDTGGNCHITASLWRNGVNRTAWTANSVSTTGKHETGSYDDPGYYANIRQTRSTDFLGISYASGYSSPTSNNEIQLGIQSCVNKPYTTYCSGGVNYR